MSKRFIHVGDYDFPKLVTENVNSKRHYVIGDELYPSITTIMGTLPSKVKGLADWRKRVGEKEASKVSTQAMSKGTAVHTMIEQYLDNELKTRFLNPIAVESFRRLQPILDKYINNIHSQEAQLWSEHLRAAGRVDCIGEFDGKLSVIDFKTSRIEKKKEWISDYFMQVCGYSIMWEERTGIPITQLVIMITPTEGNPQIFIEHRDTWSKPLIEQIEYFYQRNFNGHKRF